MASAQPVQNPASGSENPVPSPAQVLMDLTDKMTALLTATVDSADQVQHDAAVAQLKLDLIKAKEDLAAEGIRLAAERAALDARTQLIQAQSFQLTMDQNAANEVMRRRHQRPNLDSLRFTIHATFSTRQVQGLVTRQGS